MIAIYGYNEILKDIKGLKNAYPDEVCAGFWGFSRKGRKIPFVKVGRGKKKLLVLGAIHSREWVSSRFIVKLLEKALKFRESCLEVATFYLLPMVNPDGVEIFWGRESLCITEKDFNPKIFKNNANNINLNANFPYKFSAVPAARQGGCAACSEGETKAVVDICKKIPFDAAVSLHARGNCIFWSDMGNGIVKGDFELAKALEENCGFELMKPTENAEDYSGGFENWFRHSFGKPALCVELVKDEDTAFENMQENFEKWVIWEKTSEFLQVFAKFTRNLN